MAISAPYNPATGRNTTLQNALLGFDQSALPSGEQRVKLARAIARQQEAANYSPIQSPWQGVARLTRGLLGGLEEGAARRQIRADQESAKFHVGKMLNNMQLGAASPAVSSSSDQQTDTNSTASLEGDIRRSAQQRGIDPDTAVAVAKSEGLYSYTGDEGSSFGPYQLHYGGVAGGGNAVPGLGDEFTAATKLDARDPSTALQQIDFALDHAAKHGWGAFHGAAKSGIGAFEGIGRQSPNARAYTGAAQPTQLAGNIPTSDTAPAPAAPQSNNGISRAQAESAAEILNNPEAPHGAQQLAEEILKAYLVPARGPLTLAPGTGLYDQKTGTYRVPIPKDAAAKEPLKAQIVGEDAFGNKQYAVPPPADSPPGTPWRHITVDGTPLPGQPGTGADGTPIDTSLRGQEFLQQLDPGMQGRVRQILEGRGSFPAGYFQRTPDGRMLATYANAADPDFDATMFASRQKVRNDFTSGGPNSMAGTITVGNTAILHLGEAADHVESLGNFQSFGGLPGVGAANTLKNWYAMSAGTPTGDAIVKIKADIERFNEEATRFYRGLGGAEADIQRGLVSFDPNMPPSQLRGHIQEQARLLLDKVSQLQQRWHAGMGNFVPDFPVINKDGQRGLAKIFGDQKQPVGGGTNTTPVAPSGAMPVGGSTVINGIRIQRVN